MHGVLVAKTHARTAPSARRVDTFILCIYVHIGLGCYDVSVQHVKIIMTGLLTALLIIVLISCRRLYAYTEDFSVTRYRVPGVSIFLSSDTRAQSVNKIIAQ